MMPGQHAVLGPSSAHRWMTCTASVHASEGVENASSVYAEEGTAAHEVVEAFARHRFLDGPPPPDVSDEMRGYAEAYCDVIAAALDEAGPGAELLLEVRVDPLVPGCWGTSDALVVSPTLVHVIDYKHGEGIGVSAVHNSQTRLYALGGLEYASMLGYSADRVLHSIVQPRHGDGHTSTSEETADGLRAWRERLVVPAAEDALAGRGVFRPSPEACRWCPIKGDCRARAMDALMEDFSDLSPRLDAGEFARVLKRVPEIESWVKAVKDHASSLAAAGEAPPGFSVKPGARRRSITDQGEAIGRVADVAPHLVGELTRRSMLPVSKVDAILAAAGYDIEDVLGDVLDVREGAPRLVKETQSGDSDDVLVDAFS